MEKENTTQIYSSIEANFLKLNGKRWYMLQRGNYFFMMDINPDKLDLILVLLIIAS